VIQLPEISGNCGNCAHCGNWNAAKSMSYASCQLPGRRPPATGICLLKTLD
jgi:hypothetical protein